MERERRSGRQTECAVKRARRQAASGARAGRWTPNGLCASGANVAYNTSRGLYRRASCLAPVRSPAGAGKRAAMFDQRERIALLIDGANLFALKALGFDICSGPTLFRVGGGTGNGRKEAQPRREFGQRAHVWADSRPDATARNLSIAPPPTRSKCLAVTGVIRGGLRREEGFHRPYCKDELMRRSSSSRRLRHDENTQSVLRCSIRIQANRGRPAIRARIRFPPSTFRSCDLGRPRS